MVYVLMAVLAVVFFHLKIPGFSGGYVGVDIFFVISGFLISGSISDQINTGRFNFSAFYIQRIRRLLPAVLATVILRQSLPIFSYNPMPLAP